jgi:uncharacterized protein
VPSSDVAEPRVTYLVIDGENLDATLGQSILGHRPSPDERPRWERVLAHTAAVWGQQVKGLFFLYASSGHLPMPFVQALLGQGRRVALLGFREFVNGGYAELADAGLQVFDLESDAKAFVRPLPRVRILDIDAFDPAAFL